MSILIKGMEMPEERKNFTVTIKYNGLVFDTETGIQVAEAQEVPPHGRLIDADAVQDEWYRLNFDRKISDGTLAYWNYLLSNLPTIIEAEEGE